MAKGQKSSASSATRKKHALKAAGGAKQELPLPKEKKKEKGKGKNKEPRVKVFIPPTKPAPIRPDPLDSLGIAKRLPPELLVVLRRLAKKDSVTKRKALEELQSDWVDRVLKADDETGMIGATLQTALPVWLHHVPSLILSASRRIRLLASTIHVSLLRIPSIYEQIIYFLQETGDAAQIETILGSWCMAAEDVERAVAIQSRQAWNLVFRSTSSSSSGVHLDENSLSLLLVFVKRALFDPVALYADLNPIQPVFTPSLPAHAIPRNKGPGAVKRPPLPLVADEDASARKPEEDEESESDRKGRLRVGALGALRWVLEMENIMIQEQLSELLESPLLWTSLYRGPSPPFCSIHSSSGFIGDDQPLTRKAAWNVLRSLLRCHYGYVESKLLPVLSSAVLRSAWVEHDSVARASMWEPLLKFLTQFPKAWEIDVASSASLDDAEDSDEESGHDESEEQIDANVDSRVEASPLARSDAFREFLAFLALGCYGSPVQGYPTIILILSTVPPSILGTEPGAWSDFLTSFWAALDGRALTSLAPERALGSAAFLNALLECVVFLVKRSREFSESVSDDDKNDRRGAVREVVGQQMARVWEELAKDRLRVQINAAGKALAKALASLEAVNDSLFVAAWEPVVSCVMATYSPQQSESASASSKRFTMQLSLLRALSEESRGGTETPLSKALAALVRTATSALVGQAEEQVGSVGKSRLRSTDVMATQRLAEMLGHFGGLIFSESDLSSRIDIMMFKNLKKILQPEPAMQLFLAFLAQRGDDAVCLSLWRDALKAITTDSALQEETFPALLSAAERGDLPDKLRPGDGEMDALASTLVTDVLASAGAEGNEFRRTIARRLLEKPYSFISHHSASDLIHRIANAFSESSRTVMRDTDSSESIVPLRTLLMLLSSVIDARPDVALSEDIRESLPDLFVFGHVLPRTELLSSEAKALCLQARHIFSIAVSSVGLPSEQKDAVLTSVRCALRDLIADVDSRASPEAVLQIVAEGIVGNSIDLLHNLFPSQDSLEDMLQDLPFNPLDPVLAIENPLVPPPSTWVKEHSGHVAKTYDRSGLSEYARVINSLLLVAADNRDLARENMWLLRHFLIISIAANEKHLVSSATSAFFSQDVGVDTLQEIPSRVKTLMTFLLSDVREEWHKRVVLAQVNGDDESRADAVDDTIFSFVLKLLEGATVKDSLRESRVLYAVLRHVLNGANCNDSEQWMSLAKRLVKTSPNTALAIIRAVNESGLEPPSLDRYRNEVAAAILGVRASKADTDGLALLHRLGLIAPDLDSDVVFLPQNRAVNLMKVCQGWFASDEDINEEVQSEMTLVFQHLAAILQNVPGAHWDFVFDIVEDNLENCSFSDSSTLVVLARTLKLILIIQDLSSTNKLLRAIWTEREQSILTLVRDIVQNASAKGSSASVPRSDCWETALTIVQSLPPSLIDHESLSRMVHLILDPSPEVAKMAYSLLFRAAGKRTEYLVVEAGVDTSSETTKYDIPAELLQVLETSLQPSDGAEPNVLAYLLGWTLVFDLFDDASLRVKMGYATQLRDLGLIGSSFLPCVLDLLEVYSGRTRPLLLEPWSVEEYYVQFYDPDSHLSPKLFAAHLFYRALLNVPSLISTWWASCKDRQLLTSVANLTIKYYSPVLITAELRHIKDPAGVAELSGENWSIKVAAGTGEVMAAYTVDDQVMEIAVRLPPDYPLHGIEVRDVQKLGVEEKRWRGWLLAVQQIVTSQNGRIVDGLSMFKKNVTHHFENQTECAICYSIISVTELTLPKKRCKTCKNRFHAGCLFKWFNTSHTSSCPLCRSDFI